MLSIYPACFYHEENGYSVIFPDLNYLTTCGNTIEEAMTMAVDCLAGYLYSCKLDGTDIPAPSSLESIDASSIALELEPDSPPGEYFVNMISVDVQQYARVHFEKSLKKAKFNCCTGTTLSLGR